jgi:2-phosphosulfolactate phosphatase
MDGTGLPGQQGAVWFDWGLAGARAHRGAAALVIVDVLSFSTAVTIAAGRGTAVYPHPWPDPGIERFAAARDAEWARPRGQVTPGQPWSLSPASLLSGPLPGRLVLPSPNGSAIAATATSGQVLAGCLRNATAVARWLQQRGFATPQQPVAVIAAGERWPGGELRPALEDALGAGAVIAAFGRERDRSPDATAAEAAWRACAGEAARLIRDCQSGRELAAAGYPDDVSLAAQHDSQDTVPVLATGHGTQDTVPVTATGGGSRYTAPGPADAVRRELKDPDLAFRDYASRG